MRCPTNISETNLLYAEKNQIINKIGCRAKNVA